MDHSSRILALDGVSTKLGDDHVGICGRDLTRFMATLHHEGLIERYPDDRHELWRCTERGLALGLARATKPIKRERAEKELHAFLERVAAVAQDRQYLYRCRRVLLFGSMLTDVHEVGDVDLALDLVSKAPDNETRLAWDRKYVDHQLTQSRQPRTYLDELDLPRMDVMRFLKNRSRILSFHSTSDDVLNRTRTKLLVDEP